MKPGQGGGSGGQGPVKSQSTDFETEKGK